VKFVAKGKGVGGKKGVERAPVLGYKEKGTKSPPKNRSRLGRGPRDKVKGRKKPKHTTCSQNKKRGREEKQKGEASSNLSKRIRVKEKTHPGGKRKGKKFEPFARTLVYKRGGKTQGGGPLKPGEEEQRRGKTKIRKRKRGKQANVHVSPGEL